MAFQQGVDQRITKVVWVTSGGVFFFTFYFALTANNTVPSAPAITITDMPFQGSWLVLGNILEKVPGTGTTPNIVDPVTPDMRNKLFQWTPKPLWDKQELGPPGQVNQTYFVWLNSPGSAQAPSAVYAPPTVDNYMLPANQVYPDISNTLPLFSIYGQYLGNGGLIAEYVARMNTFGVQVPPEWPSGQFSSFENASIWAASMTQLSQIDHDIAASSSFFQEHPEQLSAPSVWTALSLGGDAGPRLATHNGRAIFEISSSSLKKYIKDFPNNEKFTFKVNVPNTTGLVNGRYALEGSGYPILVRKTFPVDSENVAQFLGMPNGDSASSNNGNAVVFTVECNVKDYSVKITKDGGGGGAIG